MFKLGLCIALWLIAGCGLPERSPDASAFYAATPDGLFVQVSERQSPTVARATPSTGGNVVERLVFGDRLPLLDVIETKDPEPWRVWLKVRIYTGQEAYVAAKLTNFTYALGCQTTLAEGTASANIRSAPATESQLVKEITHGENMKILGELQTLDSFPTDLWLYVKLEEGRTGWIATYLTEYPKLRISDTFRPERKCPYGNVGGGQWQLVGGDLEKKMSDILDEASDSNTTWSIDIRAIDNQGQNYIIYRKNAEKLVRPASNMKIFTAFSAIRVLPGADLRNTASFLRVRNMMKASDNIAADRILGRALKINMDTSGLRVSRALRQFLFQEGIRPIPGFTALDGSGLSYGNRVSASDIVQILASIDRRRYLSSFKDMLPIAGVDGTLARRRIHKDARIQAKTGTLISNPAVALSGFATLREPGSPRLYFSILGDSVSSVAGGRKVVDKLVREAIDAAEEGIETKESADVMLSMNRPQ